jgi:hypothetical protein
LSTFKHKRLYNIYTQDVTRCFSGTNNATEIPEKEKLFKLRNFLGKLLGVESRNFDLISPVILHDNKIYQIYQQIYIWNWKRGAILPAKPADTQQKFAIS